MDAAVGTDSGWDHHPARASAKVHWLGGSLAALELPQSAFALQPIGYSSPVQKFSTGRLAITHSAKVNMEVR